MPRLSLPEHRAHGPRGVAGETPLPAAAKEINVNKRTGVGMLAVGLGGIALLAGCESRTVVRERPAHPRARVVYAQPQEVVVVQQPAPPPPPPQDVVVVQPGPDYIWIAGAYDWSGARWVWVPGRWEHPARPGAVWVRGDWHHEAHGYRWEHGHWR
jgi:hypothetical protein